MNGWLVVAAVNGFLAVLAGAFGAHSLTGKVDPQMMGAFSTAALYHLFHALAIGIAALSMRGRAAKIAAGLFLFGIVLFCGSLYLLVLTGVRGLGIITPFGGVGFLAGWAVLAYAGWKRA
ncbi:MAG TPA: DUF423 domain-containing protein [Rhizomicrobium sp.]|nr:DUF423 domain-containing protein [Rhizomicrobium sp.]